MVRMLQEWPPQPGGAGNGLVTFWVCGLLRSIEERTDRFVAVNSCDGLSQKAGDGEGFYVKVGFGEVLIDGVGNYKATDGGFLEPLNGRIDEDAMGGAGKDSLGAFFCYESCGLGQRPGSGYDVID